MTTSRTAALCAVLALVLSPARAVAADGWGSSFSFGPSTSRIIHARTTLVPGRLAPITSNTGPLFLWPGMSNSKGDLIQTTMDAWQDNASYCGAAAGQWCVEASVFGSFGQRNGPTVAIDPDDHVTIDYKLESDGNTWTQTVTSAKLGKVVSTLQSASGPMPGTGFGFATEADADSFTIDTQYYLCTELDFAEADPKFGSTGVGAAGAKYGATGTGSGAGTAKNLHTPDAGLTWLVDLITLPAMQPQGMQTPPPEVNCGTNGVGGAGGASGAGGAPSTGGAPSRGGAPSTGGMSSGGRSSSGGSPGFGGMPAGGGRAGGEPGGAGVGVTSGGDPGLGGAATTGGTAATAGRGLGGNSSGAGGAPTTGGAPNGGSAGSAHGFGGMPASAGQNSVLGASGAGAVSSSDAGGCSCRVSRHRTPRAPLLFALGAALALRRRRRRP